MTKPSPPAKRAAKPATGPHGGQQGPVTLGDLAAGDIDLFCWCDRCHHNAVLPLGPLLREFGRRHSLPALARHLRCSRCDGKAVSLRPAWPSLGQVTRHS